jgi:hypothetical protein
MRHVRTLSIARAETDPDQRNFLLVTALRVLVVLASLFSRKF